VLARLRGFAAPGTRPRAEVIAAVRAPIPASVRQAHATWIEHALAELPARARTVLASGVRDDVDVWLARWVTAVVPPTIEPRDAIAWLTTIGADQMAFALGAAAKKLPALADAFARIAKPPRLGELGPKRAAIARCRDVSLDDDLAFVRVASRALVPHLAANQLAKLQLILTLPRPIGIVVARELALHAATSFDQCPTRAAIDAAISAQ
jgi:hypothetical protein